MKAARVGSLTFVGFLVGVGFALGVALVCAVLPALRAG